MTSTPNERPDPQPAPRGFTWCPDCMGGGTRPVPRATLSDGRVGTMLTIGTCTSCGGRGRFPGIVPPA